jgi:hypothetical protein
MQRKLIIQRNNIPIQNVDELTCAIRIVGTSSWRTEPYTDAAEITPTFRRGLKNK